MKALRLILCLWLWGLVIPAGAQIKLRQYTSATDTFYWKRYIRIAEPRRFNPGRVSLRPRSALTDAFLEKHADILPSSADSLTDTVAPLPSPGLKKYLYPVEINGDGRPDMIFQGPSGTGGTLVRMWVAVDRRFELIFEDYQYISEFRVRDGRLQSIVTADLGSRSEPLWYTREYKVAGEGADLRILRGKQVVHYSNTEAPPAAKFSPVPFESATDTLMVRASAAVLNEPFDPRLLTFGNIIARYRQKVHGTLLATRKDKAGRTWYYAEIIPSVAPAASILGEAKKIPAFLRGWVQGESVRPESR